MLRFKTKLTVIKSVQEIDGILSFYFNVFFETSTNVYVYLKQIQIGYNVELMVCLKLDFPFLVLLPIDFQRVLFIFHLNHSQEHRRICK